MQIFVDKIVLFEHVDYHSFLTKKRFDNIIPQGFKYLNNLMTCLKETSESVLCLGIPPTEGSFPNNSKKMFIKKYVDEDQMVYDVGFCNLYGLRNISIYFNLIKMFNYLKKRGYVFDSHTQIIIGETFTPFVKFFKKINKKYKCNGTIVVQDLPEFMSLGKKTFFYKILKRLDIHIFNKCLPIISKFILLSENMNKKINIYNKPYLVLEGFADEKLIFKPVLKNNNPKIIFYAGGLYESFGILKLIEACKLLTFSNFKLVVCGKGDCDKQILKESEQCNFIDFKGVVKNDVIIQMERHADILINPRPNTEEFTKYSFPSKTIEYLASGTPMIGFKLDGMPAEYSNFIIMPKNNSTKELAYTIDEFLKGHIKAPNQDKIYSFMNKKTPQYCALKLKKFLED